MESDLTCCCCNKPLIFEESTIISVSAHTNFGLETENFFMHPECFKKCHWEEPVKNSVEERTDIYGKTDA